MGAVYFLWHQLKLSCLTKASVIKHKWPHESDKIRLLYDTYVFSTLPVSWFSGCLKYLLSLFLLLSRS